MIRSEPIRPEVRIHELVRGDDNRAKLHFTKVNASEKLFPQYSFPKIEFQITGRKRTMVFGLFSKPKFDHASAKAQLKMQRYEAEAQHHATQLRPPWNEVLGLKVTILNVLPLRLLPPRLLPPRLLPPRLPPRLPPWLFPPRLLPTSLLPPSLLPWAREPLPLSRLLSRLLTKSLPKTTLPVKSLPQTKQRWRKRCRPL